MKIQPLILGFILLCINLCSVQLRADKKQLTPDELLKAYGIELTPESLTQALSNQNAIVRQNAATVLGERKERTAIPKLREELDDPSLQVQVATAGALLRMGDSSGYQTLRRVEQQTADINAALAAATFLASTGDDSSFQIILRLATDASNPMDRIGSLRALPPLLSDFKTEKQAVISVLIRALTSDPEINVRRVAASELQAFDLPEVLDAFVKVAGDSDPVVRGLAEKYLKQRGRWQETQKP
jgi:HEAT repeat protein